jgi:PAS domain S-box-containing protein
MRAKKHYRARATSRRAIQPYRDLKALALGWGSPLHPSDFVRHFTLRAETMTGSRAAALALARGNRLETVFLHNGTSAPNSETLRRLDAALSHLAGRQGEAILAGPASELVGEELAQVLGWKELVLARLTGVHGELLGLLGLADSARETSASYQELLQALAGHVSVMLENSLLISRIEQSKKQWLEDIDAIPDFIVVHDRDHLILRLNRSLARFLGKQPAELIGADMHSLRLGAEAGARPCPFCSEGAGEQSRLSVRSRTYLVTTSRARSSPPEDLRIIHVLKDITEQITYETLLQRERDFNRKILDNTQNVILVLDGEGCIRYANRRCSEAGHEESDLLGRPLEQFVVVARRAALAAAIQAALGGQSAEKVELPILRNDGKTSYFSAKLSPMLGEGGGRNSILVVLTDITEAALLQAKLLHTEKMAAVGQLVSGVAHEINNPLAAILGFADLLLEKRELPASATDDLRIIVQEAERAQVIVQNLLSFARRTPVQRGPVQINAVLKQTLQLRSYDFACHDVEVIERYQEDLPGAIGNAHELQQVFLNIVNNAYDAVRETARRGSLEIETSHRGSCADIIFRDNGPGISYPDRIFDPFFTTKPAGKGTGLGLSICYGIVQSHGGEIIGYNNAGRPGATFVVRLPLAPVEEMAEIEREAPGQV